MHWCLSISPYCCCCCCCQVVSVVYDSVRPHRRQPNRLLSPWDSPGKNTGLGCHFLLQCMKVKSESEDAQSCLTLSDRMDCSPPGSFIHGIFQARELEWVAIAFSIYIYIYIYKLYIYIYICRGGMGWTVYCMNVLVTIIQRRKKIGYVWLDLNLVLNNEENIQY